MTAIIRAIFGRCVCGQRKGWGHSPAIHHAHFAAEWPTPAPAESPAASEADLEETSWLS